jgi:hypothetical protein
MSALVNLSFCQFPMPYMRLNRIIRERRVQKEIQVQQDLKGPPVQKVTQAPQVPKAPPVQKVIQVPKGLPV